MTKTTFGDQLHQMWQTRPVRLPRQGPIAGVAAGFGQRYSIDPVLVRVALVVSTIFGGAGIVLYLLAWLLLSEAGDQSSAAESLFGKGHSSQSQTKTIVLIVALAIAVSTMGPVGVGLAGSGLISMSLMLAGWWMLHMRNPQPPPGTSSLGGFDGGLTATGYPGAAFPQRTVPGEFYSPDVPPTSMYTPYTKLPDAFIPDTPVQQAPVAPAQQADPDTVLLHDEKDEAEVIEKVSTPIDAGATPADAETVLLHKDMLDKGDAETTVLPRGDIETTALDNGTTPIGTAASAAPHSTGASTTSNVPGASSTQPLDKAAATPGASNTDATATNTGGNSSHTESASGTGTPRNLGSAHAQPTPIGITPPSWDPLGVAPLAWDLPEPTPTSTVVAPPPKRPRSRLTPVVLGLAILAAAGAGAMAASGVGWMTPGRVGAVALAVIGLGLVLGAFLRRGYGLLVLTAPLAGFVVLASMIGPIDGATVGDRTWTPTAMADLAPKYELTVGTGILDLRSLNLTENRAVEVAVQLGDANILLPEGMTVRTDCTVNLGDVHCPTGITGPNTPGAPVLDLKVHVRTGNAEVHRG